MNWSGTSLILPAAVVIPIVVGGLSASPTKAALGAAVLMCLLVYVAAYLDYLPTSDKSLEGTAILSLAVMPGMAVLALIGYGVRCAFRRLLTRNSTL